LVSGFSNPPAQPSSVEIKLWASKSTILASVCTGAGLLARAGLLDHKKSAVFTTPCAASFITHFCRATSNKISWDWVTQVSIGPNQRPIEWLKEARWVDEGSIITSAGVSAGIDMTLALVARLFSFQVALEAAQRYVNFAIVFVTFAEFKLIYSELSITGIKSLTLSG